MLADRMADSVFKCLPAVVQPLPGAKEVHKHRIIGAGRDLRNPFVPPSHVTRKDVQEVGERTCRGWRGLGGAHRLLLGLESSLLEGGRCAPLSVFTFRHLV